MTPPENKPHRLTNRGLRTILKRINDIAARLNASRDPALYEAIDRLHEAAGDIDFVMQSNDEDELTCE